MLTAAGPAAISRVAGQVSFHSTAGAQIPTPHIDRLAREGVILNNYYVHPVCSPTRSSIMSARHIAHTGIQVPASPGAPCFGLNLSFTLLPQHLKKEYGYSTYMIGKWYVARGRS